MKLKSFLLICFFITLLAASFNAWSTTIVVDPNQNTQNQVDQASPGDTLLFAPGTHDKIDIHSIISTECDPLVIMSQDVNDPAVIYEPNLNSDRAIHIFESEYVIIENLIAEGALYGIDVQHSEYIIVRDCEVRNTGQEGTKTRDRSRHVDWINNKIHDTGNRPNYSGYGECMYIGTGSYVNSMFGDADSTAFVWIENNEVYDCGNGEAVELKPWVRNSTVKGNTIYNIVPGTSYQTNEGALVVWGGDDRPGNNWVESNFIYDITWGETGGSGLVSFGGGNYLLNNTIGDCEEAAIYFNAYGDDGYYVYDFGNTIDNNTGSDYKGNLSNLRQYDPGISNPHTAQSWCGDPQVTCPNANLGQDFDWCDESSHTLTASINNNTFSYEWTANGEVISETSRQLTVTGPGEYGVMISAPDCDNSMDMIVISSDLLPDVMGDTICEEGVANLSASGTNELNWYDAMTDGNLLETGGSYMPTISQSQIFYVEEGQTVQHTAGRVDMDNSWDGGGYADRKLKFVLDQSVTLDEVTVIAKAAQTVHVRILASDNSTVLQDITASVGAGEQVVVLDVDLESGTYFMDAEGSTGTLKYDNETSSPAVDFDAYGINGVISFDAEPSWEATSNPRWRYFYNWKLTAGGSCARVPVHAVIDSSNPNCLLTSVDEFETSSLEAYPNPTNGMVSWEKESEFKLYTLEGIEMKAGSASSVDLSDLNDGVYLLDLNGAVSRIIKE
jgi:hypothetical protein